MTALPVTAVAAAFITITVISAPIIAVQKVRTLRQVDGPIVPRLMPDDEIVEVEPFGPFVTPAPQGIVMTPEQEVKGLARWEEVAVIQQPKSHSFFVENGTWLNTRVQGRVIQTLRTGRLATAPGTLIEYEHEGGELEVNGVIVRSTVGVFFEKPSYLVAVRFHPDLQKWQVVVMFELDNLGVLRPYKRRDGSSSTSTLHGLRLSEIANAISKGL